MTINVPLRNEVSASNLALFDELTKKIGSVPNLYATFAHSEHALGSYLAFQNAKSSITGKAREVVNLAVSQVNDCKYCLAAHTVIGKMHSFSDEQIFQIRRGTAPFDAKLDALARLARSMVLQRGHVDPKLVDDFLAAGWTKANLIDTIVAVGDKTVSNYLHSTTRVPVDFPAAPELPA
jgi:AhpD family alkylhydroperoxidase